jgi:molybdopterin-containing oxidoreductase family membrane subunit
MYTPTVIEVGTLIGSFGLFFSCFLFFIRLLPMIATWEVKGLAGARPSAMLGAGPPAALGAGPFGGASDIGA